ncbi:MULTISPECIES: AMP-binding protein [Paenarthrobacter]|uniref:AMP-binding protein n=1 Tax=Paenarthrobacter TaxID=1742992 RepID=UPI00074D4B4C|nr:AMP-binding protein [Paenarthrobacter ureafaciens]AMB42044.1 AMP-dependent synthetase [Arthrobacter sp. ATCC 21022]KUR62908.1 AMP-dependent synthetase [Arthrobacter sp. ATCC 21022]RWW94733.1 AMP-dependent synthetase [Paenarthrobacter ureafaciens]
MSIQPDLAGVSFAAHLASFGDRPAVHLGTDTVSYAQLACRVQEMAASFGSARRLVALEADNTLSSLTVYLAALSSGHPLLILPSGGGPAVESLLAAYEPDLIARSVDGGTTLEERRSGSKHDLHPELALLLSTSGSTGSPKLVRISAASVQANAQAIAQYLHLRPADTAATTLPLSYCYGMSVVNSHLLVGASIALTDLSVVDPCFWELMRSRSVTSFAAVPYTFDLLERVGFETMELPSLRYITQAGGRLDPARVRRYAQLGQERGWDLFVMYGQTEATARMAYLPPDEAADNPNAIGVPIPGGSFRLEPVPGLDESELVYSGPNVMLGYAEQPSDLARGRDITELRTGDLARRGPGGLYQIVGRRSRFVKIVGLRVDLGRVEKILADYGVTAAVAGSDSGLVAAVEGKHELSILAKTVAQDLGIPRAALTLCSVDSIPRLVNGKTDYPAVLALASQEPQRNPELPSAKACDDPKTIFADVLERTDVKETDTFVSLGGDSLSYVAASVRLESALGYLPDGWHLMPVCELTPKEPEAKPAGPNKAGPNPQPGTAPQRRRLIARMETGIVLRAVAIIFIVSTHVGLFDWEGTAHVLIAVAGYNFARFQLSGPRRERLKRQLKAVARIALPSMAVIGVAFATTDDYGWHNIFLLNTLVGPQGWTDMSRFWFIEILVHILVGLAALLAIPALDRAQRRWPWLLPLSLAAIDLLQRFDVIELPYPGQGPVLWLFAFGWAAALSKTWWQRSAMTLVALLTIPGSFSSEPRSATVLVGFLILLWITTLPVPRGLHRITALLATSSMYIYVTHWLVYPLFAEASLGLAVAASLAGGIAYWAFATRAMGAAERWLGRRRPSRASTAEAVA